jgi:RNA methyltransferase, TrmH family
VADHSAERLERDLVRRVHVARRDDALVVLEGFHPLKHALRFGAEVQLVLTCDTAQLGELTRAHGADLLDEIARRTTEISRRAFKQLGPYEPHTGVISVARRREHDGEQLLREHGAGPLVLLEDPRHRGNLGAVIRVAAAADAAGVLVTGEQDPWNPVVVRGSAGLHYALPVARLNVLPSGERPLIAFDPAGEHWQPERMDPDALLAFGAERAGLSQELLARAHQRVRLPMRAGVSSLNLATSVAAALYGLRLTHEATRRAGPAGRLAE